MKNNRNIRIVKDNGGIGVNHDNGACDDLYYDELIEGMKEEYDNIPIPEDLEKKVKGSISFAKQQEKQDNKRKVMGTLGGVCAAAAVMIVVVNTNSTVAQAFSKIPVLSAIVKIVDIDNYKRTTNNMEANINRPEIVIEDKNGNALVSESEQVNAKIKDYTETLMKQYEADVKASDGEGNLSIDVTYDVVTDSKSLYSIRFNQLLVMASGTEYTKIYHVDKETGNMLGLSDMFIDNTDYISMISDDIKTQMKERMAEDENQTYFLDGEVEAWNFNKISSESTFYVNEDNSLVIVFDEYDVAPGYMGKQEFVISNEVIETIVQPKYFTK